jgi:hypothetical protein
VPLIGPPNEYESEPEPEPTRTVTVNEKRDRYIKWFLDCPNWKCPECGATMMGRVKYCVYCKQRLHKDTPRPADYVENVYDRDSS